MDAIERKQKKLIRLLSKNGKPNTEKTDSKRATLSRDDIWNAGKKWYENAKDKGNRFSKLYQDLNQEILPLVGDSWSVELFLRPSSIRALAILRLRWGCQA